jgi:hypothetical protein
MKKLLLTVMACIMSTFIFAQAPASFNFQAVARDAAGNIIPNKPVSFRISILQTTAIGSIVYQETHTVSTNQYGLVNLSIGAGTIISGTFSSISWSTDKYFLKVDMDANGGSAYTDMGTQQLVSVPYALNAGTADKVTNSDNDSTNEIQTISINGTNLNLNKSGGNVPLNSVNYWNKTGSNLDYTTGKVGIGTTTPDADLEISADGSLSDPQLHIHENGNDYARINFDNNNGSNYWTIAAYIASNNRNDRLNFWNGTGGDLLSLTGDGRLGLGVGISPKTTFHVGNGERVLFGTDTLGAGDKLMFLPDLHAFRVGTVSTGAASTYWNRDSIGLYSFASGLNNRAQGYGATAMGRDCEGFGSYSFASGFFSNADGQYSTAMGFNTDALALGSTALGYSTDAEANYSFAAGYFAEAQAIYSVAIGNAVQAQSYASMAVGRYNLGGGNASSWVTSDPIFEIGNGTGPTTRSNAITVLKNGNVGIGTNSPLDALHVSGKIRLGSAETLEDGGINEIAVRGDLRPTSDNIYDLGTSTFRWDDVYATNGTINTSDRRDKENITPIHYGLAELLQLRPVSFTWKDKPQQGVKLGLIAQELLPIISEVVKTQDFKAENEDSSYTMVDLERLGVYYSDLIPVLIKSIQEQNTLIVSQGKTTQIQQDTIDQQKQKLETQQKTLLELQEQQKKDVQVLQKQLAEQQKILLELQAQIANKKQ